MNALGAPSRDSQERLKQLRTALGWRTFFGATGAHEPLLRTIVSRGEPGVLRDLLGLALEQRGDKRALLLSAVETIAAPLVPARLIELDDRLRRAGTFNGIWADGWNGVTPREVAALEVESHGGRLLLGLLASHRDGYVREAAVIRLTELAGAWVLPFLLVRASDWVPHLGMRARTAVLHRLTPENAEQLLVLIPLIDRLAQSSRSSQQGLVQALDVALQDPAARSTLMRGLRHDDVRIRRRCYALAAEAPAMELLSLLHLGVLDSDNVVRRGAYSLVPTAFDEQQRSAQFERAVDDSYVRVRRLAWEFCRERVGAAADRMREAFLFDASATLRSEAQRAWGEREGESPLRVYREAVADSSSARLVAALTGLAESGTSEDVPRVEPFLMHARARVRRAALRALGRLAPDVASDRFVEALLTDSPGVASEAARWLRKRRSDLVNADLWGRAMDATDARRILVLKLLGELEKWEHLRYLLLGAVDRSDSIRGFAVEQLVMWMNRFNRSAAPTSGRTIAALRMLLERDRDKLPKSVVTELSFLVARA